MGYYSGSDAAENVIGTYVEDSIYLYGGNDIARGSFGGDSIYGGFGRDRLIGGFQSDFLYGEENADRLVGQSGNDVLTGGGSADVLDGGIGNDRFVMDGPIEVRGDRVFGGAGVDTLEIDFTTAVGFAFAPRDSLVVTSFAGFVFRDIEQYDITGGQLADRISGWLADDSMVGNGGNDLLNGSFGDDYLQGGEGNDAVWGGGDSDLLHGDVGNDAIRGGVGDDEGYGSVGHDRMTGDNGDDSLEGGSGRDVLSGGAGNDTLKSEGFEDTAFERDVLSAGIGRDLVDIGVRDIANGQTGVDRLEADFSVSATNERWWFSAASKVFANGARVGGFESLEYVGGRGIDAITGGALGDALYGNDGNDRLGGGGGGDRLSGGDGNDVLNGSTGNDSLDGDEGNDAVAGGTGNDFISHEAGVDRLFGQTGNDTFYIDWDEESDLPYRVLIDGGVGRDTVTFASFTVSAVVDLLNQRSNDGLAYGKTLRGVDVLRGTDLDDAFSGTNLGDRFYGEDNDDVLSGRGGNDWLAGGHGADVLRGGAGSDVFDFTDYSGGWTADTVADFTRGRDKLAFEIDDLDFGSPTPPRLVTGANPRPVGSGANLLFETDNGRLWLDPDGAGDSEGSVLLLTLNGVNALSGADFLFL